MAGKALALGPSEREALKRLRVAGATLVRVSGGYWTVPDTPNESPARARKGPVGKDIPAPAWYATAAVMRKLEARGLIVRQHANASDDEDPRVITTTGRLIYARSTGDS